MPAHAVGEPWTPGPSRRGPRPGLFVDRQLCYPVLGQRYFAARPLAVRSRDSAPTRRVACRIQRVRLLPSRDALAGLSKPCIEGTPRFVAGVAPRRSPTLGSVHSGDEDRWFRELGL